MKSFLKNYKKKIVTAFLVVAVVAIGTSQAASIDLGTAADFAVLGGSGVTNAYSSTYITGDVGSHPTPAVTGLTPGMVAGNLYLIADAATATAHADLITAYAAAEGAAGGVPGPAELGGITLTPGVYIYATAAPWTAGTLTLNAGGDPTAEWIFQIGTTLVTPANAKVLFINGASAANVFWQIGTSLTLGANNTFAGNILADTSITLGGGTLNGRALAVNGAVTMSSAEAIDNTPGAVIPEPETAGNILVYATSTTATVFDLAGHTRSVETEKGFLVIEVNLTSQTVLTAQHVTYSGTSQQTANVDVAFHDDVPGYIVVEYESEDYYAELYGTDPNTDIGLHDGSGLYGKPSMKKHVATSLSGHLVVEATNYLGSGIISATLDTVRTKGANRGDGNSITTVVEGIEDYLVTRKYYYPSFIQTQIDNAIAGRTGDRPVTVTIAAGTYVESLVIGEPNVTLKSASGAAATIIAPGANYQQAIEISDVNVTIDGFTIKQGTQAYTLAHPLEHTIWVHANYSTIRNCTIIGGGNNQACIFIGGRQTLGGTRHYNVAAGTTKGHKIRNNTFRFGTATKGSGEGWGIYAVKLTDDCNISGNKFNGDAADMAAWNTNEGAPGTAILIHSADKGSCPNAVIIQNNTAQYVKYSWLTFIPSYPYNTGDGNILERPEDSEVNGVLVTNNTVHDLGKDWTHEAGVAIKFADQDKGDLTADLTIGDDGVTIRNNTFYNNGCGVEIEEPTELIGGEYGCVLQADNIIIGPKNSIYGNTSYGVYNGTIEDNQEDDPEPIDASYNWWGVASGPYHHKSNTSGHGNPVSNDITYSPYWKNAAMTIHN